MYEEKTYDIFTARNHIARLLKGTEGVIGYGLDFKTNTIIIHVETEDIKNICEDKLKHIGEFHCGKFTRTYSVLKQDISFS